MADYVRGDVPETLKASLAARDTAPLRHGAIVRFQLISLGPGISRNLRLLVMEDGRVFYAANSGEGAGKPTELFNTPLPDEPTSTVPAEIVDEIRGALDSVKFFDEAAYVANERTRDGSLAIVTARRGDTVHEVWYRNAGNELTDYLHGLASMQEEQPSYEEIIAQLKELQQRPGNE